MRRLFAIAWLDIIYLWNHPLAAVTVLCNASLLLYSAWYQGGTGGFTASSLAGEWHVAAVLFGSGVWGGILPGPWVGIIILCVFAGTAGIAARREDGRIESLRMLPMGEWSIVGGMILGRLLFAWAAWGVIAIPLLIWLAPAEMSVVGGVLAIGGVALVSFGALTSGVVSIAFLRPRARSSVWMGVGVCTLWALLAINYPYFIPAISPPLHALQKGLNPFWLLQLTAGGVLPVGTLIGSLLLIVSHVVITRAGYHYVQYVFDPRARRGIVLRRPRPIVGQLAASGVGLLIAAGILGAGFPAAVLDMTQAKVTMPSARARRLLPSFLVRTEARGIDGPIAEVYFRRLMPDRPDAEWRPATSNNDWRGVILFDNAMLPLGVDFGNPMAPLTWGHLAQIANPEADPQAITEDATRREVYADRCLKLPDSEPAGGAWLTVLESQVLGRLATDQLGWAATETSLHMNVRPAATVFGAVGATDRADAAFWTWLARSEGFAVTETGTNLERLALGITVQDEVLVVCPESLGSLTDTEVDTIRQFSRAGGSVVIVLPDPGVPVAVTDVEPLKFHESATTLGRFIEQLGVRFATGPWSAQEGVEIEIPTGNLTAGATDGIDPEQAPEARVWFDPQIFQPAGQGLTGTVHPRAYLFQPGEGIGTIRLAAGTEGAALGTADLPWPCAGIALNTVRQNELPGIPPHGRVAILAADLHDTASGRPVIGGNGDRTLAAGGLAWVAYRNAEAVAAPRKRLSPTPLGLRSSLRVGGFQWVAVGLIVVALGLGGWRWRRAQVLVVQ